MGRVSEKKGADSCAGVTNCRFTLDELSVLIFVNILALRPDVSVSATRDVKARKVPRATARLEFPLRPSVELSTGNRRHDDNIGIATLPVPLLDYVRCRFPCVTAT